jgi:tRNA (Thr-GGU) A37 N-methylase
MIELRPIGSVRSTIRDRADAPKQGRDGAPDALIEIDASLGAALDGDARTGATTERSPANR